MGKGLGEVEVLVEAESIADEIWARVTAWDDMPRSVVGTQLARAADSIGANVAEAFGRYPYADKIRFLYYARGSLFEARYWVSRAGSRGLLGAPDVELLDARLDRVARQLNAFDRNLRSQSRSARDPSEDSYSPVDVPCARALTLDEDFDTVDTQARRSELSISNP